MNTQRLALTLTFANLVLLVLTLAQTRWTTADSGVPVLRGRALELMDERGQVRSRLNVEPSGAVVLRLLDQNGTIRVKLGADADGSGLLLANDAAEPGIHLLADSTGSSLTLADRNGQQTTIKP